MIVLIAALLLSGSGEELSSSVRSDSLRIRVERAPAWTNLFVRTRGWLAADGIFSVPRLERGGTRSDENLDRILLYFGDTVWGRTDGNGNRRARPGWTFLNNTVGTLARPEPDSSAARFYTGRADSGDTSDTGKTRRAVFVPRTPEAENEHWYWLSGGFTDAAGTTYVFADRMARLDEAEGPFNFRLDGVTLVAISPESRPPFPDHRQIETPLYRPPSEEAPEMHFGAGVHVEDDFGDSGLDQSGVTCVYVYGIRGAEKELVVARAPVEAFTDFSRWRYWDGARWQKAMGEAATLTDGVSDELSVTKIADGRYLLVYQKDGISAVTAARVAPAPAGPFGPERTLHTCPEAARDPEGLDLYCYNAKAHPALSSDGELIVTYNVNSFTGGLAALERAPGYYRPRFLRLTFEAHRER